MSHDPVQSFARLYVVRSLPKRPRHRPLNSVDHYDVCFTRTGGQVRITSVVTAKGARRNRLYRSAQPEIWETVRGTLVKGDTVFFESSVVDLVGAHKHPLHR